MTKSITGRRMLAATLTAFAGYGAAQSSTPDALRPGADDRYRTTVFARGSQIYRCEMDPSEKSRGRWVFQAPEADLFNDAAMTQLMGRHYDGPTWEGLDQSKVEGTVRANVPSVLSSSIPLLLLDGKSNSKAGAFSGITAIQRLDTVGGRMTDTECSRAQWGATLRLPYTATYVFFGR